MTLQSGRYSAWNGTTARVAGRFAREAAGLAVGVSAVCALVLVAASIVAFRLGPSRPDGLGWAAAVLAFAGLSASIAIPVGVASGPALTLRAWVASGAWDGARVSGVRGMTLGMAALSLGTVAVPMLAIEHYLVPSCRFYLETAPLGRFAIAPGRALSTPMGDAIGLSSGTLLVGVERALLATTVTAASRDGAPVLVLGGVRARTRDIGIVADRFVVPASTPGSLGARSDAALAASHDGYARAILAKRTLHPLTTAMLGVALLPLGVSSRPWLGIAVLSLSVLVAVRLGDALSWQVGWVAAAMEPAWILAVAAVLWARWRDR